VLEQLGNKPSLVVQDHVFLWNQRGYNIVGTNLHPYPLNGVELVQDVDEEDVLPTTKWLL